MKTALKRVMSHFGYEVWHKSIPRRSHGHANVYKALAQKGYQLDMSLDIGANRGTWAEYIKEIWPRSTVAMFDPIALHADHLSQIANREPDISFFPIGISSRDGEMTFHETETGDGETSTFSDLTEKRSELYNSRTVPVRSIDSMMSEGLFSQPDLIKIDTEGHELAVLEGAKKTLEQCAFVQVEVNERPVDYLVDAPNLSKIFGFFEQSDFIIHDFLNISYHPKTDEIWLFDLIFENRSIDKLSV